MTLAELADAAEVTPRTVRYYIAQGLLPRPVGTGSASAYTEAHLRYLKTIKAFQMQHLPLAEIRSRLEQEPPLEPGPGSEVAASSSALDYLDRVLRPASPPAARQVGLHLAPKAGCAVAVSASSASQHPSASGSSGVRSTWDRHLLVTDVEMHVRRPLPRDIQRKLDKLLDYARHLFEEVP
jgi:DNA-binding transcriptional MerR regulator